MIHLNWKTILATTLLTATAVPVVGFAEAAGRICQPGADPSARELDLETAQTLGVDVADGVYYLKTYSFAGQTHVEVWRESNGVDGLQRDRSWNCGGEPDTLVMKTCQGCPLGL